MASDSSEAFDGYSENAKTQSIPDIISYLKYAFRPPDMDEIEKTLVLREERLKKELLARTGDMKKEYELLEKKCKELSLEYKSKEADLKKYQRNYDDLKEDFERSEEDLKMIREREKQQDERGEKKLHELRSKNSELEAAKKKAEAEVEIWMMRFNELEPRVLRLEDNIAMLTSEEPLPKKARVAGKVGGTDTRSSETFGEKEWKNQIGKTQENVSTSGGVLIQGSQTVDKVPVKEIKEKEIPKCIIKCDSPVENELTFKTAEEALIEISDSDDEETRKTSIIRGTKRKRNDGDRRRSHLQVS